MYQYNVDLRTFEEIPRHLSYHDRPRLSVSAKGYVSFNSALMHLVGKQREDCVCCGPDGRFLAFYTEKAPNFILPEKSAHRRFPELLQMLEDKGIQIPALYEMEWHEEDKVLVGCCRDLPAPPAFRPKAKAGSARSAK